MHLQSLIGGQSHHMEHLIHSLSKPDELVAEIEAGFESDEHESSDAASGDDAASQLKSPRSSKRISAASFADVADRHLKDKTDAIAHIVRNIADQCQAAVESLQLAHDAEYRSSRRHSGLSTAQSEDGNDDRSVATSDNGEERRLQPGRTSSIPPTPDLIPNRSSTAMSFASATTTPERSSQQYSMKDDIPTKIVEDDEEDFEENHGEGGAISNENGIVAKHTESLLHRPSGARISALGATGTR
jgi:hypothetical protein